jgi:hypothetical protein
LFNINLPFTTLEAIKLKEDQQSVLSDHLVFAPSIDLMYRLFHTMFAPAQLLANWHQHWPSNKCDLDLYVTREVGRVLHGVNLLLI